MNEHMKTMKKADERTKTYEQNNYMMNAKERH